MIFAVLDPSSLTLCINLYEQHGGVVCDKAATSDKVGWRLGGSAYGNIVSHAPAECVTGHVFHYIDVVCSRTCQSVHAATVDK